MPSPREEGADPDDAGKEPSVPSESPICLPSSSSSSTAPHADSRMVERVQMCRSVLDIPPEEARQVQRHILRLALGRLVKLNLYDIHPKFAVVNELFHRYLSFGIFHAGVEIYGVEYMFGNFLEPSGEPSQRRGSGIAAHPPRKHNRHVYKETIWMGRTPLTEAEAKAMIVGMAPEWQSADYDVARKNCVHFVNVLTQKLGVGPVPPCLLNAPDEFTKVVDKIGSLFSGITGAPAMTGNTRGDASSWMSAQTAWGDVPEDSPVDDPLALRVAMRAAVAPGPPRMKVSSLDFSGARARSSDCLTESTLDTSAELQPALEELGRVRRSYLCSRSQSFESPRSMGVEAVEDDVAFNAESWADVPDEPDPPLPMQRLEQDSRC